MKNNMAIFQKKKKQEENKEQIKKEKVEESSDYVETKLVFHPEWEINEREKYIYKYYHQKLPKLKPNQISISKIKHSRYEDLLFVTAFLRNTLPKTIKFDELNLVLLDENNKPFAKKLFDMEDLVEIPPRSCVPCEFIFDQESFIGEDVTDKTDKWTIAFELKRKELPHQLDLEASWENQLSTVQREQLEKLVEGLPKLSPGEVNFMGIEAKFIQDHAFAVTLLIRNGSEKDIKLEQIPLIVEDGDGDIVCQGGFQLDNFVVKANTSKPWTFIFPAELVHKTNPNLSRWKVYPPNSKKSEK